MARSRLLKPRRQTLKVRLFSSGGIEYAIGRLLRDFRRSRAGAFDSRPDTKLDLPFASRFCPNTPLTCDVTETPLTRWLGPLVNLSKEHMHDLPEDKSTALRILVEENVKAQVENIATNAVITNAWEKYVKEGDSGKQKKVYVHGWVYGLEDGRLRDLGVSHGPPTTEC